MDASDLHLENALAEYNDRVNQLESGEDPAALMEAYVNRGCVLQMLEYRTSAMDDLESAAEIMDSLESMGAEPDPGIYVRIHATMASILFDQEGDCTAEYAMAASRLGSLGPGSRHFDRRSLVKTCIEASKNLIDSEDPEGALPFISKAMSLVEGHHDAWSRNREVEALGLQAEAASDAGDLQGSVELYSRAIDLGVELMGSGQLEDPEELVMAFAMRADAEGDLGLTEMYIADMESAITVLEHMMEFNRLPDPEVLVGLHHDVAGALMKTGRIADAEKHLMKAMQIGVRGAGDYINLHGNR